MHYIIMKTIAIVLFFIGVFFIVHGIYDQKIKELTNKKTVEYKYIQDSCLEKQFVSANDFHTLYNDDPWYERNISEFNKRSLASK